MIKPAVLVVDDDSIVLRAVARSMSPYFDITSAANAGQALQALRTGTPFSVIMSDLNMPGGNGVQLLNYSRKHHPDVVRVMMSGVARLHDAIAAINEGQVFRLLMKPFEASGMRVVLNAAVAQHRLLTAERVLLEETLHGSIKALTDLLAIAQPMAFGRAMRIRDHCTDLAQVAEITPRWDIEVAAVLSLIGAVTLSATTLERWYHDHDLTPEDQVQVDALPAAALALIADIPRLDTVRTILRRQFEPSNATGLPRGCAVLAIARDYESLHGEGRDASKCLQIMEARGLQYDLGLLKLFRRIRVGDGAVAVIKEMPLLDVNESMVFASDVHSAKGLLLIARGQRVTSAMISRLHTQTFGLSATTPVRMIVPPDASILPD